MKKKQGKTIIRLALLVGTLISLYFVPWPILKAWIAPLPDAIEEQVQEATQHGFEGIIVYVDEGGRSPGYYAAGWHDRDKQIPADPHALFKIASISKLYDAVSVAKLVHSERLSLDKTLVEYLPELNGRIEYADTITLRMLVQHQSGIPNVTNTPNFWINPPKSSTEALERVFDLPANFEPGQGYEYSNTNYILISEIIERELGYGTFQYIKEVILDPLGLQNTYGSLSDVDPDRLMSGYYVGVEEDIKTTDYGSMIATAEDVGTFIRALNDGTLLNEGEEEIYSSLYEYDHTGLIPGYQSIAKYHKEIDTVVIQFTNTTNFDGYLWNISEVVYNRILKIIKGQIAEEG